MSTELRIKIDRGDSPREECGMCDWERDWGAVGQGHGCELFDERLGGDAYATQRCQACLDAEVVPDPAPC